MRSELFTRVEGIVKRITYKPGWKLVVTESGEGWGRTISLIVLMYVNDLKNDGAMTSFMYHKPIRTADLERMKDCEIVDLYIREALKVCELHEMDEWLKMDGVNVVDPHPELGPQRA